MVRRCAPRNTPTEIIDRLSREINAGLADPKIKARLTDLGSTVLADSPADFGKLIADETEKWGKSRSASRCRRVFSDRDRSVARLRRNLRGRNF